MKKSLLCVCGVIVGAVLLAATSRAADQGPAWKHVLVFSKSAGFIHDAFKTDGAKGHGYGIRVLEKIGPEQHVVFTYTKDGTLITPEFLARFDAFFLYTSGDLTMEKSDPRGDGLPPMTPAGKAALLAAVAGGKGLVGYHSASDSFHSFGRNGHVPERFDSDGDKTDDYLKMLGGEFIRHGEQQKSHLIAADPKFPGMSGFAADLTLHEEWYSLKNFASDLHVLLVQDTAGMKGAEYQRAPYPSTWVRMHGKGRVFYSNLGHREDIWDHPAFQALLTGALNWSLGRVDADVTPNLKQVAPQANVLPKYEAPPAPAPKAGEKK